MSVALSVEHLSFAYPPLGSQRGAPPVLSDLHFALRSDEWLVVLGATGSGKTTLCWTLAGLVPSMTGGTLTGSVRRADGQSIGFVFQDADAQLFNMTVEDELAFGFETSGLSRAEMQARVQQWLAWARLEGMSARAPWQLSGGQKKRLALASVLALAPSVLVLDEPTAGLDPISAQEVLERLNELRHVGQHAVCLATSDAELAAHYADRVLVLDGGRIVREGTPHAILSQPEHLRTLGIGVPQIADLAHALNARGGTYHFITIDEAEKALTKDEG